MKEDISEMNNLGLLSIEQVLGLLQIGRSALYNLINRKQLVAVKIGKRTLFRPQDIKNYIESLSEYGENYYG